MIVQSRNLLFLQNCLSFYSNVSLLLCSWNHSSRLLCDNMNRMHRKWTTCLAENIITNRLRRIFYATAIHFVSPFERIQYKVKVSAVYIVSERYLQSYSIHLYWLIIGLCAFWQFDISRIVYWNITKKNIYTHTLHRCILLIHNSVEVYSRFCEQHLWICTRMYMHCLQHSQQFRKASSIVTFVDNNVHSTIVLCTLNRYRLYWLNFDSCVCNIEIVESFRYNVRYLRLYNYSKWVWMSEILSHLSPKNSDNDNAYHFCAMYFSLLALKETCILRNVRKSIQSTIILNYLIYLQSCDVENGSFLWWLLSKN